MSDAVAITRLEGKIDVISTQLVHMMEYWQSANTRLNSHSDRISAIENKQIQQQSEKDGMTKVVKVLWAILAVLLTGGVVTIVGVVATLKGAIK